MQEKSLIKKTPQRYEILNFEIVYIGEGLLYDAGYIEGLCLIIVVLNHKGPEGLREPSVH
jgi:hypothetical protein